MKSHLKLIAGVPACIALVMSGLGCSDSGGKRAVADSSGTHYRSHDTGTALTPAPTQGSSYDSRASYESDAPRRIVRVSADDPAIYGTRATATYDDGSPRTSRHTSSSRIRSAMTAPEAPPLLPPEQMSRTPRAGEFWVSSHWRWDGNRYVLEPGRMEKLRSNELYHPAKWTQTDQGWEFTPAYWD